MVLDTDGKQTPGEHRQGRADPPRGRPAVRRSNGSGCSIWTRRSLVAERYGKGRVFLAGDAVHQLSPTGALGMNTGIGDVVDLGWKLAAVAQGWGGPNLLASYDSERQPIGMRNIDKTAGFHLSHGKFEDGFAAIEDDSDEGRALRAQARPGTGARGRPHVPHHRPAARLSLRGFADHACPTARRRRRTIRRTSSPRRAPARARRTWRCADGRSTLDLYGRGFVLARFGADAPDGARDRRPPPRRAACRCAR